MIVKRPRNILFIQLGDIGDVVLSFPCIRAIKETFPEANIVVVAWEKSQGLAQMCKWASEVIAVSKQKRSIIEEIKREFGFILKLRSYNFDMAFDLRTGTRGAILALLSGAKQRISFHSEDGILWRNKMFTNLYKHTDVPNLHVIDYHLELFNSFNITTKYKEPELTVPEIKKQDLEKLFSEKSIPLNKPLVVVQPFSLWGYKEWPVGKFVDLIEWFHLEYNLPVLICGGPGERSKVAKIIDKCVGDVSSLVGDTSISMYAAILDYCCLLISVDSSGPHIAAASGTPTVTIYGPSSPKTWAPRGEKHIVVQSDLPCVPCHQTGCEGRMVSRCIDELPVLEVKKAVEEQMRSILP